MATVKRAKKSQDIAPPASTPEARENQLIALAVNLAEQQLRDGTASPSVITHYLKLASTREKLEMEMLKHKTELVTAQTQAIESAKHVEELYQNAIDAMRRYSGSTTEEEPDGYY